MLNTPRAYRGMVVTPHHQASRAGLEILREGGNAVEAVIAAVSVLCVAYPHMTGLGGDGFWLIRQPGRVPVAIDACGRSAGLATPELFRKAGHHSIPFRGPLAAITVPGAVSGWIEALKLAAQTSKPLPLERLLEEARFLAESGIPVTAHQAELTAIKKAELENQPGFSGQFLTESVAMRQGARLQLPALAGTFARLCKAGLGDFYTGCLAREMAHELELAGSPLRAEDLAGQQAIRRSPLRLKLPGVELFNLPAPTQGMASLIILGLFARLGVEHAEGFDHIHALVEAAKKSFAIRDRIMGDPDQMTENPQSFLEDSVLDDLASGISMQRALPWPGRKPDAGDTVWLGAVDAQGMSVSYIQSIFFEYGSGVVLPGSGVTMQNRGVAFELDGNGPRLLAPGRKPYHTLNPAMALFEDGRTLAYGTMGGEGQPQTQGAFFTRYALFGQQIQEALTAPRWVQGRTWGGEAVTLKMEDRFDPELLDALRAAGHEVEVVKPFDSMMGHAGAIALKPDGTLEGGVDPRGDGTVACY
ncbi:MAG: gamma-glutamyltransferase family protein [Desulfovibrio sp.]|nr:gamma-glutamyltransferase family protein [Desulfovibrio sp.]MBI4958663.1 gamma-glutamyltransferase family protein [Desulfovibrio sp.]